MTLKMKPAKGTKGFIIRTGDNGYMFRVYDKDHNFIDYDILHYDVEMKILEDAVFCDDGKRQWIDYKEY